MAAVTYSKSVNTSPWYSFQLKKFGVGALIFLIACSVAFIYLLPFGQMLTTAFKSAEQIVGNTDGLIFPMSPRTFTYEGEA